MRPKDAKREWDGDKPFFHLIYNAEASHYHSWQEPNPPLHAHASRTRTRIRTRTPWRAGVAILRAVQWSIGYP